MLNFTITNNGTDPLRIDTRSAGQQYGDSTNEGPGTGLLPFDSTEVAVGASQDFSVETVIRITDLQGAEPDASLDQVGGP